MPNDSEGSLNKKIPRVGPKPPKGVTRADWNAERRSALVEAVRKGTNITKARYLLDINDKQYYRWRVGFPGFASLIDTARATHLAEQEDGGGYRGDFISFRKTYFGFDTYWHQAEIVRAIENAAPGSVTLILVPPEHGKTTLMEDYCNYRIGTDPNVRITICSEGQPHARKILRRIAARMEDPQKAPGYLGRFGPFVAPSRQISKPWAADFLTVAGANHDERDYTLEARGWRSTVAGTRTDLLLVDDIQSMRSINVTELMFETFRQDFLSRPGKDGATIIVGTRVGVNDFYETCMAQGVVDDVIEYAAINEKGEPLCPEMWPKAALARRRLQVGEDAWWRNYMQSPRKAGSQVFTTELVEPALDPTRKMNQLSPGMVDVVMAIDPALSGITAFGVAGYNSQKLEITDMWSVPGIGSIEAICTQIEMGINRAPKVPSTLVIEGNAFQRGLVQDERLADISRRYGFRIVEHVTHTNKNDEDIGVARMPTSFIANGISIPWGDDETMKRMKSFVDELYSWRPRTKGTLLRQDKVMVLWFMWLHWRRWGDNPPGSTSMIRRPGLPWQPTHNIMRTRGVLHR